jgi:hypothetical protein
VGSSTDHVPKLASSIGFPLSVSITMYLPDTVYTTLPIGLEQIGCCLLLQDTRSHGPMSCCLRVRVPSCACAIALLDNTVPARSTITDVTTLILLIFTLPVKGRILNTFDALSTGAGATNPSFSFDYFVSTYEYRNRHIYAQRCCGPEVYYHFEFIILLNRQVCSLFTLENTCNI